MKTYAITHAQIFELAEAICLLDWLKKRVPDESPDKAEAAVRAERCHALLEEVLHDDAGTLYWKDDGERDVTPHGRCLKLLIDNTGASHEPA
jgi:hypothetical protein